MIYSPQHGDTALTVPLFDEFMKRTMPDLPGPARRRRRSKRSVATRSGMNAPLAHAMLDLVARTKSTANDCEFAALDISLGTEDKTLLAARPKVCRSLVEASETR